MCGPSSAQEGAGAAAQPAEKAKEGGAQGPLPGDSNKPEEDVHTAKEIEDSSRTVSNVVEYVQRKMYTLLKRSKIPVERDRPQHRKALVQLHSQQRKAKEGGAQGPLPGDSNKPEEDVHTAKEIEDSSRTGPSSAQEGAGAAAQPAEKAKEGGAQGPLPGDSNKGTDFDDK
ncbi:hypothetical protein COOONC_01731 [Cooperia oncophora]